MIIDYLDQTQDNSNNKPSQDANIMKIKKLNVDLSDSDSDN